MTESASDAPRRWRPPAWWVLVLVVLLLVLGTGWGAYTIFQQREQRYRHQIEGALSVASLLQAKSIADWRGRRQADAAALLDDSLFAQAVARWRAAPAPASEEPVRERLRILVERAQYNVAYLVDPNGRLLLSPGGAATGELPLAERDALRRALQQAEPVLVEMHRDASFAFPFFGVIAPVFDGARPVAAVWLVLDVRATLYPLLETWPATSRTAESVLALRQGDDVLYLSPLRHRLGEPLTLRQHLAGAARDDPVVLAAQGTRGIVYGRDYRDEEVLAMVTTVPASPWLLISKVDTADAFTDGQRREGLALGLLASLGLLLAGSVAAWWQWRVWRRERALTTELERNMRWLESAQKAASMGYFVYDRSQQLFFVSPMVSAICGLPHAGRLGLQQWLGLLQPDERERILQAHTDALAGRGPLRAQYGIRRASDGLERWIEVWGELGIDDGQARLTGTVQDITERKRTEEQLAGYRAALEERVRLDPLTQVANRLALDEAVAEAWGHALEHRSALALLMIDVDHFKAYNDYYGHIAGDHCLQRVARVFSGSMLRATDLVARYGGEEFVVLLPGADAPQAAEVAERLCAAVRSQALDHNDRPGGGCVSVSIGVASLRPVQVAQADGKPRAGVDLAQALFQQADAALYWAKQAGRDQVAVYDADRMAVLHAHAPHMFEPKMADGAY